MVKKRKMTTMDTKVAPLRVSVALMLYNGHYLTYAATDLKKLTHLMWTNAWPLIKVIMPLRHNLGSSGPLSSLI